MKTQRGHQEKNKYVTFTEEMRRQIAKQLEAISKIDL